MTDFGDSVKQNASDNDDNNQNTLTSESLKAEMLSHTLIDGNEEHKKSLFGKNQSR